MDRAKLTTDTLDLIIYNSHIVRGRSVWAEAGMKIPVDHSDLRILAWVATKIGEKPIRQKG